MSRRTIFFGALAILMIGFLLLQILPLVRGHDNPPVVEEPNWDSPDTRELVQRACFDCHSNETEWPWYSYIFPMSEMLQNDVERGREALNFSEWNVTGREQSATEEMVETISKGQMPLPYYLTLHPEARLTESEEGRLINGLIATFDQGGGDLDEENLEEGEEDGEELQPSPGD